MVYHTRSTASRSIIPTREKPPIEDESQSESSDEDDEGIPNKISLSARRNNGTISLRPLKRPPDDESLPWGKSKRQRNGANGHILGLREGQLRSASTSSLSAARAIDWKAASNKSTSPDAGNDVSDDLVNCVSSILTSWNGPARPKTPEESPRHQYLEEEQTELILNKSGKDEAGYALQTIDGNNPEPPIHSNEQLDGLSNTRKPDFEGDNSDVQSDVVAPDDEPHALEEDPSTTPDNSVSLDVKERPPVVSQKPPRVQQDPYEIHSSPEPPVPLIEPSDPAAKAPQPGTEQVTESRLESMPSSPPAQDSRLHLGNVPSQMHAPHEDRNTQVRDENSDVERGPCAEADVGTGDLSMDSAARALIWEVLDFHRGDENHGINNYRHRNYHSDSSNDDDQDIGSPIIDGIEPDVEVGSDFDLSVEESFSRDIDVFKNRHIPEIEVLTEGFEPPRKDDLNAIHIQRDKLEKALSLMRIKPWSEGQSSLGATMAVTQPGQHIMPLLAKLKRLCLATPGAPLLEEQNMFLAAHSDMITYYFSKIDTMITHIHTERLARLGRNQSSTKQAKKRSEMAEEVVSIIIPMIVSVLESTWKLGGDSEDKTLFTISTCEFLRRGIGWITRLYHRASSELAKYDEPRLWWTTQKWKAKQGNIARFRPLLSELAAQINDVPGMFQAKKVEEMEKQQMRELQKNTAMIWEQRRRAEKQRIEEQNRRAFLSIEEKSVPLTSSKSPENRAISTVHQFPPWSREEEEFLLGQLRQTYPELPDLAGNLRRELDRELDDIIDMSKVILRSMLREGYGIVGIETSPADIEAGIENMFMSSIRP